MSFRQQQQQQQHQSPAPRRRPSGRKVNRSNSTNTEDLNGQSLHSLFSNDFTDVSIENDNLSPIPSGGGSAMNNFNNSSSHYHDTFTEEETKAVNFVKIVVYFVLTIAAAGFGFATYSILAKEQNRVYETDFVATAELCSYGISSKIKEIETQLSVTSSAITSQGITTTTTTTSSNGGGGVANNFTTIPWPYVTIPQFDQRMQDFQKTTHAIIYAPIVSSSIDVRLGWESYSVKEQGWIDDCLLYRGWTATTMDIPNQIWNTTSDDDEYDDGDDQQQQQQQQELFVPVWQMSPVPTNRSVINLDLLHSYPNISNTIKEILNRMDGDDYAAATDDTAVVMSGTMGMDFLIDLGLVMTVNEGREEEEEEEYDDINNSSPMSMLAVPVLGDFTENATIVGFVLGFFTWESVLETAMIGSSSSPSSDGDNAVDDKNGLEPILVSVEESCGPGFSYRVDADKVTYLGPECNLDECLSSSSRGRNDLMFSFELMNTCEYTMTVLPTSDFKKVYDESSPVLYAILAALLFLLIMSVFFMYDCVVQQRQQKLLSTANRTKAVVSSLFPEDVQKRIMDEAAEAEEKKKEKNLTRLSVPNRMKDFLQSEKIKSGAVDRMHHEITTTEKGKPIADFFPEATIMFGDLVGFTAWSSMREPSQVFTLLESIYHAFDEIARRRRVFKVETVGDCYVAVAGLPEPCDDHALVMCRFASDCRVKMNDLVKKLERSLGPDTTELAMRFGLHSGPVTAGVLRGDKARFQLFGDTVNTTSRMESTGKRDKIHISSETAQYVINAGKDHWLKLREDKVTAKGKGELTTYWLSVDAYRSRSKSNTSSIGTDSTNSYSDSKVDLDFLSSLDEPLPRSSNHKEEDKLSEKHGRLVDWITSELSEILKEIEISRISRKQPVENVVDLELLSVTREGMKNPLDEVKDIITLPTYSAISQPSAASRASYSLSVAVQKELHTYVSNLAGMYQDNPFHNFEHASHVTMSVCKLMSRIVAPNIHFDGDDIEAILHDKTYGITSDPLTQFTVVLAALIHDVDHPGVPNSQLTAEKTRLASIYRNKSIAEQNSVDLAWNLLMEGNFTHLRQSIYQTQAEFKRFRQLLVQTVMATDIMDKELGAQRRNRWNEAFSGEMKEDELTAVNRKATIVIEHIIQASDIAHTMQHWHIYRKWNSRLFEEMYKAYTEGRATRNPAQTWYEGEIGFFDFYIIPLAKKLKECGVFGVSSDEYLNYAMQNRREWELNGENVISGMVESIRMKTAQAYRKPAAKRKNSKEPERKSINIDQLRLRMIPQEIMTELPKKMSLLIVDDDKIVRKLFSRSVSTLAPEWMVDFASSGEEALALVAKSISAYDLIFMDHYFGDGVEKEVLLGTDVITQLREKGVRSRICGMSANDVESMFEDSGADAFIFKPLPLRKDALERELLRILNGGGF